MAAYDATRNEAQARLGRARRPISDTRVRRYLSRELRLARDESREEPEQLRRVGVLQQIFLDQLPSNIAAELQEVRRMELTGESLIRRLEAMRERYRINPAESDDGLTPAAAEVVRIVCSDALTR